jgi:hypothetical protein
MVKVVRVKAVRVKVVYDRQMGLKGEGFLPHVIMGGWLAIRTLAQCGPVKQLENSVKIQPYNSRPTLCPKSRI